MKEFPAALGAFTERLEAVEPPEEVTDWHNAVLVYQRALKMELDDGPGEGESEDEYIFGTLLTLALEHQPDISASIMAMNGEILARMIEAGCIDEDDLGLTLTEGEGNEVPVGAGGGDGGIAITAMPAKRFRRAENTPRRSLRKTTRAPRRGHLDHRHSLSPASNLATSSPNRVSHIPSFPMVSRRRST